MPTFRFTLEYDGTDFQGWQVQPGGRRTVQGVLEAGIRRLLDAEFPVAATVTQVPAFVGQAGALSIELVEELDAKEAEDHLAQAEGVELWSRDGEGPNLRAASGREVVLVGRVRKDASVEHGLQLWLAADVLRLSAANAVALAVARFRAH